MWHVVGLGQLSAGLGQTGISQLQDRVASGPGTERLPVAVKSPNGRTTWLSYHSLYVIPTAVGRSPQAGLKNIFGPIWFLGFCNPLAQARSSVTAHNHKTTTAMKMCNMKMTVTCHICMWRFSRLKMWHNMSHPMKKVEIVQYLEFSWAVCIRT